ncbi:MAG: SMC-Scp complex subunit ScpB [Omnitrophica WOR_2 bacterium RIFOXYB2_FULL_45_11]|nr:MAG: SMC-Scp complex subunit ScpB [Omnitrophica WOR_2 bacterium RIFOXYB2_FULL_45_11]OGX61020.1 MAG: SMC-Scp complex subunit ScpB [Omnitrophica WOR_2 bacterium RIFOXYC2_FULL_45_15]
MSSELLDDFNYKSAVEALLFISEKPLLLEQIKTALEGLDTPKIREIILGLKNEYENGSRGLRIEEVAGGFRMVTSPDTALVLKKFYKQRDAQRLSTQALETLAIIAYKQPVTRLDIESLRGVNVDGVVKTLLEKNLIRIAGKKDIIGRPFVYGTTRQFLEYFGLKSLDDLPKLEEFTPLEAGCRRQPSDASGVLPLTGFTKTMDEPAAAAKLLSLSNRPEENSIIIEENKDGEPAKTETAHRQS